MKKREKIRLNKEKTKGQTGVITVVLIILVTLVSVVIVWNVVYLVLKDTTEEFGAEQFSLGADIKNFNLIDDYTVSVRLQRTPGAGDVTGIKFIFEDFEGNTYIYENKTYVPDEIETNIYILTNDTLGLSNLLILESVSVHYLYKKEDGSGKEKVTRKLDSRKISSGGGGSPSPVGCTAEPSLTTCGTDVCGTKTNNCGDSVNCLPGCGIGEDCISGACTVVWTEITSCQDLTIPNMLYKLSTDAVNPIETTDCLVVLDQNITIDCQGHTIAVEPGLIGRFGVVSQYYNTTVKNCNIRGAVYGVGIFISGIGTNNVTIINNTIHGQQIGIYLKDTKYALVKDNHIFNNSDVGVKIAPNSVGSGESRDNIVTDNNLSFNGGVGIEVSSSNDNIIKNNYIQSNGYSPGDYSGLTFLGSYATNNIVENNILCSNIFSDVGCIVGAPSNQLFNNNSCTNIDSCVISCNSCT